ncbi:universal stress protein [Halorussus marinus]|uniref:universal stress protein n=1 Tax=Halorussus marinus TaxID=2505976 RepID=UPI001091DFCF|nr:universal stress protein [Halorussus marinus]
MYERILIPTDGSDAVDPAVERAIDLASTYDAELHAVNVVNLASLSTEIHTPAVIESFEEQGEVAVEAIAERAADAGVEDVATEVIHGTPHRTILDYADDHDVDMIVMGTHGRSGLNRYLLGSVTEKVVRTADVPVLTVRTSESTEE